MKNEYPSRRSPPLHPVEESSIKGVRAQLDALKAEYLASDMPRDALVLGARMRLLINEITHAYVRAAGDDARNRRIAQKYAYDYIQDIFRVSQSKIRLHVQAFDRFHRNAAAVEYLCLTDMQLLLGREIGEDVIDAVIQRRKDTPHISTREVKELIRSMRVRALPGTDDDRLSVAA